MTTINTAMPTSAVRYQQNDVETILYNRNIVGLARRLKQTIYIDYMRQRTMFMFV